MRAVGERRVAVRHLPSWRDASQAKWLPLARDLRIIGTYAQTELGHGSFIRGMETTATYVPETQEFELHSPTLSATKWWPGCLGKTSTHCVVMARLVTQGKEHGVHAFIVQLRSLQVRLRAAPALAASPALTARARCARTTRCCLASLSGTSAPRWGTRPTTTVGRARGARVRWLILRTRALAPPCAGFLRFDRVRVPRDHMLMRHAQVAPDGAYSRPAHDKIGCASVIAACAARSP